MFQHDQSSVDWAALVSEAEARGWAQHASVAGHLLSPEVSLVWLSAVAWPRSLLAVLVSLQPRMEMTLLLFCWLHCSFLGFRLCCADQKSCKPLFEFWNASSVLQQWVSDTACPAAVEHGNPGLKVLCYEVINVGLLLTKISRNSWEVCRSDVQNTAAEKIFNNSQWSHSSETMLILAHWF